MRGFSLTALIVPILISVSHARGATVGELVGDWDLTGKSCSSGSLHPHSTESLFESMFEPEPFLPMPSRLTMKFTRKVLTVDATYYGCVYRLKGPYHLSRDLVRLHTDKATNQCNGDTIDVPVEPFKVDVQGQNMEVSGLLKGARLCPPGQTPRFSFRKQ